MRSRPSADALRNSITRASRDSDQTDLLITADNELSYCFAID